MLPITSFLCRGFIFGAFLVLAGCASENHNGGGAKEVPVGGAASPSPPAILAEAVDDSAVWLKDTRLDEGQFQRDRLRQGLVADQAPAPYSDDTLTDRTNADSGPYKSPSRELLEKARARALDARAGWASESQGRTRSQGAVALRRVGVEGGSAQSSTPAPVAASEERAPGPPSEPPVTLNQGAAITGSAIKIQLSSLPAQADAAREGSRLRALYSEILDGKDVFIDRVDLGAQGLFHRVQFGPFKDISAAEQTCWRLKELGQDCLVLSGRAAGGDGRS